MAKTEGPLIRNISDTALWVAVFRARETERQDALFRDTFARKLAGERGEQIAKDMRQGMRHEWPYTARTVRFDQIVTEQIKQGTDMVINLAAGLDTRPYRMDLPSSLKWIEVDLPGMMDYKEEFLGKGTTLCPGAGAPGSGGCRRAAFAVPEIGRQCRESSCCHRGPSGLSDTR